MSWLNNLLMIVQVLSALGVIILVLMQHGKGADMGAAFGSGSSGSLLGATGSASFLSRSTGGLETVFFVSTLALALLANPRPQAPTSVMEGAGQSTLPSENGDALAGAAQKVDNSAAPASGAAKPAPASNQSVPLQ